MLSVIRETPNERPLKFLTDVPSSLISRSERMNITRDILYPAAVAMRGTARVQRLRYQQRPQFSRRKHGSNRGRTLPQEGRYAEC
jgi:hypothetical protein